MSVVIGRGKAQAVLLFTETHAPVPTVAPENEAGQSEKPKRGRKKAQAPAS